MVLCFRFYVLIKYPKKILYFPFKTNGFGQKLSPSHTISPETIHLIRKAKSNKTKNQNQIYFGQVSDPECGREDGKTLNLGKKMVYREKIL